MTVTPEHPERAAEALRTRVLLRERSFRSYWAAGSVSLLGDAVTALALPFTAVLFLRADALQMGLLSALIWLPALLFSIHLGAVVQRVGHPRSVLVIADIGRAVLLAGVVVAAAMDLLTLTQLFVTVFLFGTCSALSKIADNTMFVAITRPADFVAAQSLVTGSSSVAALIGPNIAGVLITAWSAPLTLLVDLVSFVSSALLLSRIGTQPRTPPPARERARIAAGLGYLFRSGAMRPVLLMTATANLAWFAFGALYLLYFTNVLRLDTQGIAVVATADAAGSIVGAVGAKRVVGLLGLGATMFGSIPCYMLPLAVVPFVHGSGVLAMIALTAAMALSGAGVGLMNICVGTYFSAQVPDELRSRVRGAYQSISFGVRPLGALLGGVLGTGFGERPVLFAAALVGSCGALWLPGSPILRQD